MSSEILWSPQSDNAEKSALSKFSNQLGFNNTSFQELHAWSIKNKEEFWRAVWILRRLLETQALLVLFLIK